MQVGNQFRSYPMSDLAATLRRWIGCQRFIYNAKVSEDRYYRGFARKFASNVSAPMDQEYSRFIGPDTAWLREVPSQVLRNGTVKWRQAYARFFKGLAGRPKIHGKDGKQSVWLTSELFRFEPVVDDNGVVLRQRLILGTAKRPVGELPFVAHKEFLAPASIHISVQAERWFVSFNYDDGAPEFSEEEIAAWLQGFAPGDLLAKARGLDFGVVKPVADNVGGVFDFTPQQKRGIQRREKQIKRTQRTLARRLKGSKRRLKAKQRLATLHWQGANVRRDFAHKASRTLVNEPMISLFCCEDLKIRNMTRSARGTAAAPGRNVRQKAGLDRAILASSWGQIRLFLGYKARRAHKLLVRVPARHTSQECSRCGHISPDNRPSQDRFVCQACGYAANADHNAAENIRRRGVDLLLSGQWSVKAVKKVGLTKTKVRAERSEPAAEKSDAIARGEDVRRGCLRAPAQPSSNRETPITISGEI
ncbi:MAG TPA: transposase [Telmatospirillum sp.]|nr:transposase [Telmatospirillum sp.]